jgi:hypothetical protein
MLAEASRVLAPLCSSAIDAVRRVIEDRRFERFIVGAIVINAITLGIETSSTAMQQVGGLLHLIDHALLAMSSLRSSPRLRFTVVNSGATPGACSTSS